MLSFWVSECNNRIWALNKLCQFHSDVLQSLKFLETGFSSEYFTEMLLSYIFGPRVVKYNVLGNETTCNYRLPIFWNWPLSLASMPMEHISSVKLRAVSGQTTPALKGWPVCHKQVSSYLQTGWSGQPVLTNLSSVKVYADSPWIDSCNPWFQQIVNKCSVLLMSWQ